MRRLIGIAGITLCAAIAAARAHGQVTLFSDDFESGGADWKVTGKPQILWHVAPAGECGSVTRMACYDRAPAACDYDTGGANSGDLISRTFMLNGSPPFTLTFDYLQAFDPGGDYAEVDIVDSLDSSNFDLIACCFANQSVPQRVTFDLPNGSYWSGRSIQLRFTVHANPFGNTSSGWMVDNVLLERACSNDPSWSNYGSGWPGMSGVPSLTSRGAPMLCAPLEIDLDRSAPATTIAALFIGPRAADLPTSFDGHLLVLPGIVMSLELPAGTTPLGGQLPCDPALCGLPVYLQALELDAAASRGVSFTPGLLLILG